MLLIMFGVGLGFCGGVAAVLGVQALVEHKSFGSTATGDFTSLKSDLRQGISDLAAEVKKLAGFKTGS